MPDTKISERPAADTVTGSEMIGVIQAGLDKRLTIAEITDFASVGGITYVSPSGTDRGTAQIAEPGLNYIADGATSNVNNAILLPTNPTAGMRVTIFHAGISIYDAIIYTSNIIGSFQYGGITNVSYALPSGDTAVTFVCVKNDVDGDIWTQESRGIVVDNTYTMGVQSPTNPPSQLAVYNFLQYYGTIYRKTTLVSAWVLGLNTTPITLIPAPGAGRAIFPISYLIRVNYGSTTYSAVNIAFKIGANFDPLASVAGVINAAGNAMFRGIFGTSIGFTGADSVTNQPMQVYAVGSNPTTGNSSIDIYIMYNIITL